MMPNDGSDLDCRRPDDEIAKMIRLEMDEDLTDKITTTIVALASGRPVVNCARQARRRQCLIITGLVLIVA
jgi:hypothetical protein